MNDEKLKTERFFWQTLNRTGVQAGLVTHWERSGNVVGWKEFSQGIRKFHGQPAGYGFYGVMMEVGQIPGYQVHLVIENQNEVIFGIQLFESREMYTESDESEMADFLVNLVNNFSGWDFDGISFLAWKSPGIRFDFRNSESQALGDVFEQKDDSEALTRFLEEVSEILGQMKRVINKKREVVYGTVID